MYNIIWSKRLSRLGLSRLKTDPSIWILKTKDEQGRVTVHGAVGAHVDDFLLIGGQHDPLWQTFLQNFHESLRWSPWEVGPFTHCGVLLEQDAHGHWHLTQEEFCKGLSQVEEDGKTKDLTPNEQHQCRAVLGAAQWRCYQTAPQHCAKLSHLQSMIARGDRTTLKDINKFVREIYHQANTKISVFNLHASEDDEIVLLGWSERCSGKSGGFDIHWWLHHRLCPQEDAWEGRGRTDKSCELEHSQAEEDLPLQSWSWSSGTGWVRSRDVPDQGALAGAVG